PELVFGGRFWRRWPRSQDCWERAARTRPAATSRPRIRTSCSRPRRRSSRGTRPRGWRRSRCSRGSRATPLDFGMVIPTPGRPRLDEMPRDFFKELAVYTILKKREYPQSRLLPVPPRKLATLAETASATRDAGQGHPRPTTVKVLEAGVVG